jgi:hypothetical protein
MLLAGFAMSPHDTTVQIICISSDNDKNKNETRVYVYALQMPHFSCKTKCCDVLTIQIFWVGMLSSRVLVSIVLKE